MTSMGGKGSEEGGNMIEKEGRQVRYGVNSGNLRLLGEKEV